MGVAQTTRRRRVDYGRSLLQIIVLFILLSACLSILFILFQWQNVQQLPMFLRPYAPILLVLSPYIRYFNALIILILGYFVVGEMSKVAYAYMRGFADQSSAATVQNITRVVGFGVLLAMLASVFSVDPAAALTLGGFGGLVVGFATQTFLANTIAGIFVLITRPFTFGDVVTISGNIGTVKEIRIMHLLLETSDGSKDILIPNSLVLSQVILKNRPGARMGPTPTTLTLDQPPQKANIREKTVFMGKLTETASRKPIAEATVLVFDKDIGKDDLLGEGVTDVEGTYKVEWEVRKVDEFDYTAEVYAKFEGDEDHRSCHTKQYIIETLK
jgi:small-conductance mechanosensitive channel